MGDAFPVHQAITYFENHHHRMNYRRNLDLGLPIGSGYVEVAVAATMCLSLGLLCHAARTASTGAWVVGVFGAASLMSMKLIVWPGVAVLGLFALFIAPRAARGVRGLGVGIVGAAAIALPGPIRNFIETGYPLSVPLRVGPITLGPPNAELDHLEATFSAMVEHGLAAEIGALAWSFGSPLRIDPQLTVTALPILALAALGAVREIRRGGFARTRMLWMLAVLGGVLAGWLSPSLEIVRLHWTRANARHILPVVLPLLPLAFVALRGRPTFESILRLGMIGAAAVHALLCIGHFWAKVAYRDTALPATITLVAVFILPIFTAIRRRERGRAPLAPAACAAIALSATAIVAAIAFHDFPSDARFIRFGAQSPLGPVPKYWVDPARMTNDPDRPYTIALTSGLQPAADNWFMYAFFGAAHQNRLVHASVTDSDSPLPLAPGHGRAERARFDVWWRNLEELEADWVMAFHPEALELAWMMERPDLFQWRMGDRRTWGLYRIRRGRRGS